MGYNNKRRRSTFRRTVVSIVSVIVICILLFMAYQKFGAPAPESASAVPGDTPEAETDAGQPSDTVTDFHNEPEEAVSDTAPDTAAADETAESETGSVDGMDARNIILYNVDTGSVIYERASEDQLAPASSTKLLTALTALDHVSEDEIVTVGEEIELIGEDSTTAWLNVGDQLTVRQLLTAMLLPSGNDAAYAMAVYTGRSIAGNSDLSFDEAVSTFTEVMNKKAAQVGAVNSNYLTPDGYDTDGQYTTARDLVYIGAACLDNATLAEIAGSTRISNTWTNGREVTYENTNQLLNPDSEFYNEHVTGLKTGTSIAAGNCLVSSALIDSQRYVCVVMGSTEVGRWTDSLHLYETVTD